MKITHPHSFSKDELDQLSRDYDVLVIGAGLSGSEAALSLSRLGYKIALFEMRPHKMSEAHHGAKPAELVCSNSLKSKELITAGGLLKKEIEVLGSSLLPLAYEASVAAGSALAVDRDEFSSLVEQEIAGSENIDYFELEFSQIKELAGKMYVLVAAGPLASSALADELRDIAGAGLSFMDAAAPIVMKDSLDMERVFPASRYGRGEADDYLNVAFTKDEYELFHTELVDAKKAIAKDFESKDLFQACQPVEEIARKGFDALRYGALKPVGISDPRSKERPFAVLQLRAETRAKTSYNLVGFQTNLTWGEQQRVFRLIPGFEEAEFVRLGVMHKNTFINAPSQVKYSQEHKKFDKLFFAGQILGTEGYTEAIASGLMAALQIDRKIKGGEPLTLPVHLALGSLYAYAFDENTVDYQPMHVNFGLVEPLEEKVKNKRLRYLEYSRRALEALKVFIAENELPLLKSESDAILSAAEQELDAKREEILESSSNKRKK